MRKLLILGLLTWIFWGIGVTQGLAQMKGGGILPLSKGQDKDKDQPITITAPRAEFDNKQHTAKYTGDVMVKRGTSTLTCDQMLAWFEEDAQKNQKISKLMAEGRVKLLTEQYIITSKKAEYFEQEKKLVFTEDVVCVQDKNTIAGDKITYLMDDDRILVEGNARSVMYPKEDQEAGTGAGKPKPASKPEVKH